MKSLKSKLGYAAAALTVVVALLVPFVLTGTFSRVFAGLGLHVDEMYSGGPVVRTIQANGYTVAVHRAVSPHYLQREAPFVQLDWSPAAALPAQVREDVDVDGDGRPDVRVSFDVPRDPKALLHGNVEALNARYQSRQNLARQKFSSLIVRVDDAILVRVPLATP